MKPLVHPHGPGDWNQHAYCRLSLRNGDLPREVTATFDALLERVCGKLSNEYIEFAFDADYSLHYRVRNRSGDFIMLPSPRRIYTFVRDELVALVADFPLPAWEDGIESDSAAQRHRYGIATALSRLSRVFQSRTSTSPSRRPNSRALTVARFDQLQHWINGRLRDGTLAEALRQQRS